MEDPKTADKFSPQDRDTMLNECRDVEKVTHADDTTANDEQLNHVLSMHACCSDCMLATTISAAARAR